MIYADQKDDRCYVPFDKRHLNAIRGPDMTAVVIESVLLSLEKKTRMADGRYIRVTSKVRFRASADRGAGVSAMRSRLKHEEAEPSRREDDSITLEFAMYDMPESLQCRGLWNITIC